MQRHPCRTYRATSGYTCWGLEELPTLLVPVPVFRAAPGRRFHSTLPAGNATGYEANIEYVSDTKIKYRVGTYITSMDIYGIGRA